MNTEPIAFDDAAHAAESDTCPIARFQRGPIAHFPGLPLFAASLHLAGASGAVFCRSNGGLAAMNRSSLFFRYFLVWLLSLIMATCSAWGLAAGTPDTTASALRFALVVGNADYAFGRLANPANDARAVANRLRELGFETDLRLDLGHHALLRAIAEFGQRIQPGNVGLIYFAGHGVQVQGSNYLLPVDARLGGERTLVSEAVEANLLVAQLEAASVGIVILDACRNNPFERQVRSISADGLARIDAPVGKFIAFATAPGSVASDGDGDNSLYTAALLQALQHPGRKLEEVFKSVRARVVEESHGRQVPWESSSLIGDFYFLPPDGSPRPLQDSAAIAWEQARSSRSLVVLSDFVARYPGSDQAPVAHDMINKMRSTSVNVGEAFRDCPACPEMRILPSGSFMLGSPGQEPGRFDDEGSALSMHVDKPFAIGVNEISVAEFRDFTDATGYRTEAERNVTAPGCFAWDRAASEWNWRDNRDWRQPGFNQGNRHPVVCVSWSDAVAYTEWLSRLSGKAYRLPTELEFEYAARAGSASAYFWGARAEEACLYANVEDAGSYKEASWRTKHDCDDRQRFTAPVASYVPNGFGLYDLIGNVSEWTATCWSPDGPMLAKKDMSCGGRVIKGGAWNDGPRASRAAYRGRMAGSARTDFVGFRVALTLP